MLVGTAIILYEFNEMTRRKGTNCRGCKIALSREAVAETNDRFN